MRPLLLPFAALAAALLASAAAAADFATVETAAQAQDMDAARAMLAQGAEADAAGPGGETALHWAAHFQDIETARALLDAGADADRANLLGVRPLHLAVSLGDADMAALLIRAGADPDGRDGAGETPLMLAARDGGDRLAALLLEAGAAADAKDPEFQHSALMLAARGGHVAVARLLLDHGADPNAATRLGPEPQWRRPEDNKGSRGDGIVRGGWPPRGERAPRSGGMTPLLYAARQGHPEMIALLLDAGAQVGTAEANAITPLLMAVSNDKMEAARLLLEAGADVNAIDWYGRTPLWSAVNIRNLEIPDVGMSNGVDRERALDMIRALLEAGADPNPRTREVMPDRGWVLNLGNFKWVNTIGQTPFFRAALSGDVTVMRLLLQYGADPNIEAGEGTTPLMAAAGVDWVFNQTFDEGEEQLLEAVKLCHQLGNDPAQVNSMGIGAIHGAANRGSTSIVEYLASVGVPLDAPDNEGRTPLDWANGVFLATNAPFPKPETIAAIERLQDKS